MKFYLFIIAISIVSSLLAEPIPFSPIVHNYTISDYYASPQNWAVEQDEKGVMYFGNNKGLLVFDGSNWILHELPNKGIVRSIYIDNQGRIFVGSYEELGYFTRSTDGNLIYNSLIPLIKDYSFHNDEFWNIISHNGNIIFQSFNSILVFDGTSVKGKRAKQLPLNIFQVENSCYSQLINSGLAIIQNNNFQEIISRNILGESDVKNAFSIGKEELLLFMRNGNILKYNNNIINTCQFEYNNELRQHTVNNVIQTKDSCFIVGTISNGIYAYNKNGELKWKVNTDNGLSNNTVLRLFCDDDNNIWAALDDGIAYIQNNSLVYYYKPQHRKIGMVYDVLNKGNEAYFASNQGLYYLNNGNLEIIPGLTEQTWFIDEYNNQIFCGHNKGTFLISKSKPKLISPARGSMYMTEIDINGKKYLLGGTYSHLNLYEYTDKGCKFVRQLRRFSHMVSHIETDIQNNIWIEHWQKGLYRLNISPKLDEVENIKSYMTLGKESDIRFTLFKINGRVVFSNNNEFFTYEDMNDTIVPFTNMNNQLKEIKNIHSVTYTKDNLYWFINDNMAYLVSCEMNTFKIVNRIPFSLFEKSLTEERASIVYDSNHECSYLCLNNAIARIDTDSTKLYYGTKQKQIWISQIIASNNKEGKEIKLPVINNNVIKADMNSISFILSYPDFNKNYYKIRYKLDGFSDKWTEAESKLTAQYVRLPSGEYKFKAEVYDENGVLSTTELTFKILPPWYSSTWAIIVYIISGLLLVLLVQYWVYNSIKRKKDKIIEQQRIAHQAEIDKQEKKIISLENERLEANLRFKSKELAGVVMTNIAHQEFLESLKSEIQQFMLAGQYSRKNLDKLLTLINNNLVSDEESWSMFQANFDRIHENFFRNLKLQFPDLTSGDLRFCALLRLNMPNKEIAKFLNISVRGVDAARYRLRKKFNLSSEDSLTDFIINFK